MNRFYPSHGLFLLLLVLIMGLANHQIAFSNNPCTAIVYDFGQGLLDTVPCGNGANTVSNIDIDDAGTTTYALYGDCGDVLPAPHNDVAWFTFIIQEGGSAFEWQLIETGNDDVLYEIYYSNDPGGENECTDLSFYTCGDDFNSWQVLGVPNPHQPTRYYVALYTQNPDNNISVNLKFRKACGESCTNSDLLAIASEDVCINQGEMTTLSAAALNGDGNIFTYIWSPNDGSILDINSQNATVNPTETTTYTVAITDSNGCPAYDEVTVTVGLTVAF